MSVKEIEIAVERLSPPERDELIDRLNQWREEQWDKQIEEDSRAGRLDFLKEEAKEATRKNLLKPI